ncbi:hypothetical protein KIH27_16265 [Mycobacterium sp. M1]|uniref:Secreted protein n=1 Tax=Mycolicibacter acidiphilus TaxID=2835306 RepID=A0ABS5RLF7_9MYCO|nr:hypothetical protein [Mycolicibacter acidiphilus]MBS9535142.1 hypothetical protein [Mycolicibacter acidiphilus]
MKLVNTAAAVTLGVATTLGAGVLVRAAPAEALPPGTYFCWSHLVPNTQQCPPVPPWGDRWVACPSETLYFVLDDVNKCIGNISAADTYTFNCWGRNMVLGKICPPVAPPPDNWRPCPNLPGNVWTLDGDCHRPY